MSEEKPTLVEVLFAKRKFVLTMLMVPVFGMAIAALLILYKKPDNMVVALGVILFIAVQYILMMYFWFKRLETLLEKEKQEKPEKTREPEPLIAEAFEAPEGVLVPEEKRVFPANDK